MTGWLRRNAGWLAAIPVAAAVMVAGSSYRVHSWWTNDYRREVAHVRAGQTLDFDQPYTDVVGRSRRHFQVRALGLQRVAMITPDDFGPPKALPAGLAAYRVRLAFTADPDQQLHSCLLWLIGSDGRWYGGMEMDPGGNPLDQVDVCLPANHPGPDYPTDAHRPRPAVQPGKERPRSWTVAPIVIVPEKARLVSVRLAFETTHYVTLDLPRSP